MPVSSLDDDDMAMCVSMTMGVMGLLITIFGVSSVGLGVTVGWYYLPYDNVGYPYIPLWGGCVYVIAGFLGLSVACCCRNKSRGKLRCIALTFSILCFLSALIGFSQCIFEAWWSSRVTLDDFFTEYNQALAVHMRRLHNASAVFGGMMGIFGIIGGIVGCVMGC